MLKIQTFPGLTYQIQQSTDLEIWTNHGAAISGTGDLQNMDLGVVQDPNAFYRIQISN